MKNGFVLKALMLCIGWVGCCGAGSTIHSGKCLYLPPSFADRVIFYDGFELPGASPEINRIDAQIAGSSIVESDGFAGHGCRSSQPKLGQKPFTVHSPHLAVDRALTVMRWWRVDAAMEETSCFQLLSLLGKGHISCFVRGKGEWCALRRPTMFVQVDHFPAITNINWQVKENAYFQPGDWHHIAVTVANASEIGFYLDGAPLVTVHAKGRLFTADDINALQAFSDAGDFSELPTSTDELIVVDRALSGDEIQHYCIATRGLKAMALPPLLQSSRIQTTWR